MYTYMVSWRDRMYRDAADLVADSYHNALCSLPERVEDAAEL